MSGPVDPPTLHVIVSSQRRGAEVFSQDLVGELTRRGQPNRLVALRAADAEAALPVPVLGRRPLDVATLRALRREVRSTGAPAVVAHGSRTLPACAVSLAATGVPFAYRSIGDPRAWSASGLRRMRTTVAMRRARFVVVLWPGAADAVREHHGVPADRIRVVPNGVDGRRCPPAGDAERQRARQALGLPADAAVVAYAGSLTAEKRVHHAVEAVADVRGLHLLVAGSGPDREALEARAARRAAGRVRFLGALDDVSSVLAAADAVVLTSTTEGMPGILVEAGLRARAVVAYDVGGVGEIVADGETGCLVRSGDVPAFGAAMRRVLADAAAMGAAGRQRCLDRFEIGVVAGPWAELIAEMAPR